MNTPISKHSIIIVNNFQTPMEFDVKTVINNTEITYKNVLEIADDSPVVGLLFIDNRFVKGHLFGGPFLYQDGYLYVPVYVKKFVGWGFKLAKIDTMRHDITIMGELKSLIYLDKIEENLIYYYEDMGKTKLANYEI